jgi:hypothetical protein
MQALRTPDECFRGIVSGHLSGPERLIARIPVAANQPHADIASASFYIIEDAWDELGRRSIAFIRRPAD